MSALRISGLDLEYHHGTSWLLLEKKQELLGKNPLDIQFTLPVILKKKGGSNLVLVIFCTPLKYQEPSRNWVRVKVDLYRITYGQDQNKVRVKVRVSVYVRVRVEASVRVTNRVRV